MKYMIFGMILILISLIYHSLMEMYLCIPLMVFMNLNLFVLPEHLLMLVTSIFVTHFICLTPKAMPSVSLTPQNIFQILPNTQCIDRPSAIARSVAMSLGNQEALQLILASGTSFREDLVMKLFLRPFFLFR